MAAVGKLSRSGVGPDGTIRGLGVGCATPGVANTIPRAITKKPRAIANKPLKVLVVLISLASFDQPNRGHMLYVFIPRRHDAGSDQIQQETAEIDFVLRTSP